MASLELKKICGDTFYIPSPANIGVYAVDGKAILIDSGNDKEAGRQICRLLDSAGLELLMIVNTHSNADHAGGNAFILQKTGCRVAATAPEAAFIENPMLEPAFLFGGFPHAGIRNKFLMAQPSKVTDILDPGGCVPGTALETVPLPGHFFGMIGVKTPDSVFFAADTIFSGHIVGKYGVFYLFDIEKHLETLSMLEKLEADYYVPSHASLMQRDEFLGLIKINRDKVFEISGEVSSLCAGGIETDSILAGLCARYSIELNDNQYVLVMSTLKAYLVYLLGRGEISKDYSGGRLFWKRT